MKTIYKYLLHGVLNFISQNTQERLGQYILNRSKGQGNGDPFTNGEYNLISKVKSQFANSNAVVFDVGANKGEWTAHFAAGMSERLMIISFEPIPETFSQLTSNLALQCFHINSKTVNAALSDSTGTTSMFVDKNNPLAGTNSLTLRNAHVYGLEQKKVEGIQLITGDDFCVDNGISHIDFVKIDTEGHECAVIRGFAKMLSQRQIDVIQFEYGGTWIDSKSHLSEIFDLFVPCGYTICRLHPNRLEIFSEYDQRQESFVFANYVAIRQELLAIYENL
ncbi:MAG: FkbM family methyltransferase [Desulfuromonadaceae bacterium]|nr:FkbM family methyltransferase [Desulfuromonadaceae bacterium]